MRYLWLASVAAVLAFAAAPKASAFDMQTSYDTNADGSSRYSDADDALEDSVNGGHGMPAYQFQMPRFGGTQADASQRPVPWDAERKRLVFGPFNDQVYDELSWLK